MAQSAGRSVKVYVLPESTTPGIPEFPAGGVGINTTVASVNLQPGGLSLTVASATGIVDGMILKVGDVTNVEYFIVSGAPAGNVVTLKSTAKPQNLHKIGEAVVDVSPSTAKWKQVTDVRSIEPNAERDLQRSQALTGLAVLSAFRPGNYSNDLSVQAELGIENSGLWLLAPMNTAYNTNGSTPTLADDLDESGGTAVGDTTFETTGSGTYSAGDFVVINPGGDTEEVVKVLTHTGNTVTIDPDVHFAGLRYAHADAEVTNKVVAPFTHKIKTGADILRGLTFAVIFDDNDFAVLIRGARCGNENIDFNTSDLPTIDMSWQSRATQVFSENIFGTVNTANTLSHTPYVHWETSLTINSVKLTTNLPESLQLVKNVDLSGSPVVGSPYPASITPGDSSFEGNMTTQLESLLFSELVATGSVVPTKINMEYSLDANHSIEWDMPESIYTGNINPTAPSRDPITQAVQFISKLNTAQNTDVIITYKNESATLNVGI